MLITSNPHTHSTYVDGKNTLTEMVEAALSLGFTALGFSEHARQPLDAAYGLNEKTEQDYIDEVRRLQSAYASRIRIWLGMERDRLSPADRRLYEYVIGANHYLVSDGDVAAVDSNGQLEPFVQKHCGGSWKAAYARYYDEYAGYIETLKPDIIAHFDLIVKYNRTSHWFDEADEDYLACGRRAMDRMISACRVLEVNTGGIARSGQPCPYPILPLLRHWRALGGEVIPASDCHRAHQLGAYFDECPAYIRAAGFDHMLTLGTGRSLFEEVALE